jgi:hypothetical protein
LAKCLLEIDHIRGGLRGVKSAGGSARVAAATSLVKGLGGKIDPSDVAFGGSDAYVAVLADVSVAAAEMAVGAGGGATARTVVLLTTAQLDAAAEKETTYRPPGN